jgi:hypothetical protein
LNLEKSEISVQKVRLDFVAKMMMMSLRMGLINRRPRLILGMLLKLDLVVEEEMKLKEIVFFH